MYLCVAYEWSEVILALLIGEDTNAPAVWARLQAFFDKKNTSESLAEMQAALAVRLNWIRPTQPFENMAHLHREVEYGFQRMVYDFSDYARRWWRGWTGNTNDCINKRLEFIRVQIRIFSTKGKRMSKLRHAIRRIFMKEEDSVQEELIIRDVKVRIGKSRLNRHIAHQQQIENRLRELARKAVELNNNDRYKQVTGQLLWTRADISRWEKYKLIMDLLDIHQEQATMSVELLKSVKALSESIIDLTGPKHAADLQTQIQEGLARADGLDERLSVLIKMVDSILEGSLPADDDQISDSDKTLTDQSRNQNYCKEIEEGMRNIRKELNNQKR